MEGEQVKMTTGRVVIVTGAGNGLGFHVAKTLCEDGSDVILAGRDEEEIKAAVEKIKQIKPEVIASHLQLDLTNMESVRKFVDEFRALGKKLNGLVTCDGVKLNNSVRCRRYTSDNFELTMGANHLGHFLLTNLLLSDLKNTALDGGEARVVVVTSSLHDAKTTKQCKNLQLLDVDNLFLFNDKTYSSLQAYKNSRAANLLFAYDLARRVQDLGIKVNAVCPGVEPTEETASGNGVHKMFAQVFMHCITAPPASFERCAADVCSLITEEKFKDTTGKYVKDGAEIQSSEETLNEELQTKLWEMSARYVRLDGFEPLEVVLPPVEEEPCKKKEEKAKKKAKKGKTEEDENVDEKEIIQNGHKEVEQPAEDKVEETAEKVNGENHVDETPALNGTEPVNQEDESTPSAVDCNEVDKICEEKCDEGISQSDVLIESTPVVENGVEHQ